MASKFFAKFYIFALAKPTATNYVTASRTDSSAG